MPETAFSDQSAIIALFERQRAKAMEMRGTSVADRKELLKGFEKFLLTQQERIKATVHQDFKKPMAEVGLSELYPVIGEIRHTVEHLEEWSRPRKVDAPLTYLGTRAEVRVEPKGVCLIIAPWNFPFNLCFGPLVSCLAAGNTVVLKPSEMTSATSALIKSLVTEYFQDDLVVTVEGGPEVTTALLKQPFDHIFFTGSPEVGKIVMKAAAENLSSVTLELGGKSPVIIDATADINDAARRIAFGKFLNNGQTCIAPDYVLVEESVRQQFIAKLKSRVIEMFGENGSIGEDSPSYSRIVNRRHYDRVNDLVNDAVQKGARKELTGATNPETNFIHPVILSNVPLNAKIMEQEIFGPVLPVIGYTSGIDVIKMINDRPKPLALYIFSHEKKFRQTVLQQTSAGSVCINDCVIQFSHPELPFGGVNNSGIGKAHGHAGFLAFSNEKPVVSQKNGFSSMYLIHPPYTAKVKKIIDLMIRWF
jgi:aldehyde dehydrogenase (NAD+)